MIVDIIIIAIFAFAAYRGFKVGLVHSILNFFGSFGSAILAYFLFPIFKTFLINVLSIDKFILEKVVTKMKELGAAGAPQAVSGADIDALNKLMLPEPVKKSMTDFLTSSTTEITKSVAMSVTDFIMSVLAFGLLFISILILFKVLRRLLKGVVKLPILNGLNTAGGLIFALVSTYITITIGFLLLTSFFSIGSTSFIAEQLASSKLAGMLISFNPLLIILSGTKAV